MFLRDSHNDDLVVVINPAEAFDPSIVHVDVRYQAGEEQGDPVKVAKSQLLFPSGEPLPKAWLDMHYRVHFE